MVMVRRQLLADSTLALFSELLVPWSNLLLVFESIEVAFSIGKPKAKKAECRKRKAESGKRCALFLFGAVLCLNEVEVLIKARTEGHSV